MHQVPPNENTQTMNSVNKEKEIVSIINEEMESSDDEDSSIVKHQFIEQNMQEKFQDYHTKVIA